MTDTTNNGNSRAKSWALGSALAGAGLIVRIVTAERSPPMPPRRLQRQRQAVQPRKGRAGGGADRCNFCSP